MFRVNRIKRVSFLGVRVATPLVPYNFRERHRHSFSVFVGNPPQRAIGPFNECLLTRRGV
jgi:hypothetical protein